MSCQNQLKYIAQNLKPLCVFHLISGSYPHVILWWLVWLACTFSGLMRLPLLIHFGKLFLSNMVDLIYALILIINKNIFTLKQKTEVMVYGLLKCCVQTYFSKMHQNDLLQIQMQITRAILLEYCSCYPKQGEYEDDVNIYNVLVSKTKL